VGRRYLRGKIHKQYSPFTCNETKLKSWEKNGELKEDKERGTLGFSPNPDLKVGESVEITVTYSKAARQSFHK
jgi:hypothetical protein